MYDSDAMYYAAKILPVFVLPFGLAVILVLVSVIVRKRWPAILALFILCLSSLPIASDALMRAVEGWQVRQPVSSAPNADAIVVLSGMLRTAPGREGFDEWSEGVDRFEAGVALLKAGKAPTLVFTRGWMEGHAGGRLEGDILAGRATALGIDRGQIAVSASASNTADEAQAVGRLLRDRVPGKAAPSIILVTSAFHIRRSRLLFSRAGMNVTPFPVDFLVSSQRPTVLRFVPSGWSLYQTETATRELYGYLYYALINRR